LIVYQRLLDAFCGKTREGKPDWETSDLARNKDLFVPESYRMEVFRFVQGNVCPKDDLGVKVTAGGLIGICNWHALAEAAETEEESAVEAPGVPPDPKDIAASALPLSPGTSAGNSLEMLNRRFERGGVLRYLSNMPSLLVFNDEAHHIHELRSEGEITEVEWQKSLRNIAGTKGQRFIQVDFSATPFNQIGSGQKAKAVYFPHIIADFDLKAAMKAGLVKLLVLDKRRELGALANAELQFKADRDEHGNAVLSEGQRIMVRAGLTKLQKLEQEFGALDAVANHIIREFGRKLPELTEAESLTPPEIGHRKLSEVDHLAVLHVDWRGIVSRVSQQGWFIGGNFELCPFASKGGGQRSAF